MSAEPIEDPGGDGSPVSALTILALLLIAALVLGVLR